MRTLLCFVVALLLALPAHAANYKISDLTLITSPSTNTFIEVADMDLTLANRSRKYLFTNLVTQAQLSASDLWTNAAGRVRLVDTNSNPILELQGNDGAGQGSVELWSGGVKRWTMDGGTLYPNSAYDLGTSVNPVNTGYFGGATGILLGSRIVSASTGDPEGVRIAPVGSLFLRTDGASGTTLYTKTSGTGNTGWEVVGGGTQTINNLTINGKVTINNNANIETLYTGGNTNVIDLSIASATNEITAAITFAHATNGLAGAQRIHDRWFFVPSGGPYTLTIPSTWRTNVYSAVPPSLTNACITRMIVTGMADPSTSAAQTNCYVSFEYYK